MLLDRPPVWGSRAISLVNASSQTPNLSQRERSLDAKTGFDNPSFFIYIQFSIDGIEIQLNSTTQRVGTGVTRLIVEGEPMTTHFVNEEQEFSTMKWLVTQEFRGVFSRGQKGIRIVLYTGVFSINGCHSLTGLETFRSEFDQHGRLEYLLRDSVVWFSACFHSELSRRTRRWWKCPPDGTWLETIRRSLSQCFSGHNTNSMFYYRCT